jgi:hypothetical protein
MPTRVGGGRKAAFYVGGLMMVAGFLLAFASFLPAFSLFGAAGDFAGGALGAAGRGRPPEPAAVTGFMGQVQSRVYTTLLMAAGGAALIVAGAFVRRAGSHGLAGSGLVLDPQRARDEVKPWSEMHGGVLRDTLDAADVDLGRRGAAPAGPRADGMPFDEKLRRLHKLRQEGLISEEEYQRERREILDAP